ncbi:class I SAM-dependent methyltransferase [Plantactinospora sp. KBS50]|uniref:class I SAM-dependent methyltransferase n=1 Tax=Plantactinospora sp. KBS50 TaxID=2024580 RepID=UPI0012FDD99F|nr:class I SAM-dependent methyltransferase [Plantactinospora sp. KBS50]
MTGAAAAAREANRRCYHQADTTLQYVDSPYHALRRQLIGEALVEALDGVDVGTPARGALLELGCGARSIFDSVGDLGRTTVVADLSWSALSELKAERHRLLRLDASGPLPLADRSVAGVVAAELIEHLYHPGDLLAEIARVLRPGGVLVLSTPNLATVQDRVRFLFGRSPRQVDPLHAYLYLHIRPFTAEMLRRMLHAAGFVDVQVRSNYVSVPAGRGRWLHSRLLARMFPGLGGSLVVDARTPADSG